MNPLGHIFDIVDINMLKLGGPAQGPLRGCTRHADCAQIRGRRRRQHPDVATDKLARAAFGNPERALIAMVNVVTHTLGALLLQSRF